MAQAGRLAEAAAYLEQFSRESASSVLGELAAGFACALNGDAEAAQHAVGPATALAGKYDQAIAHYLSQLYALVGDAAQASEWLERAIKTGYLDYPEVVRDRCYRQIESDRQFQNVIAEMRCRWQSFEP